MGEGRSNLDAARLRYLNERYALDKPVLVQYLHWLGHLSPVTYVTSSHEESSTPGPRYTSGEVQLRWPDLGESFVKGRPVGAVIAEALPVTVLINLLAMALVYIVAVPTGVLAARRPGGRLDRFMHALYSWAWSMPLMLTSVLALGWLASRRGLGLFPTSGLHDPDAASFLFLPGYDDAGTFQRGYALDAAWHLCLPVLCLAFGGVAVVWRQTRATVASMMTSDFVRTARAKGVPERDVLVHHALRAGLLPLITIFTGALPLLLSGSVVVERVFELPGMGNLIVEAVMMRDRELLLGAVLIAGVVNIVALLLADILYAAADPRVSHG